MVIKEREPAEKMMIEEIEKKWGSGKIRGLTEATRKHALSLSGRIKEIAEMIRSEYVFCERDDAIPYWYRLQWRRFNRKSAFHL
jgi:hypothetical protein